MSNSNTFLFELGTEEIPADMIVPALGQLRSVLETLLEENQIGFGEIRCFSTPRRLAVIVAKLPDRQPDRQELQVGPPESLALGADGKLTRAGEGFARKWGVASSDLEVVETGKGRYLSYRQQIEGRPVPEILGQGMPDVISALNWPKNMYWRPSRFRFVRPLRWYVALWNSEEIPFEFEKVRSGRTTRGHRFLGSSQIVLDHPDQYLDRLQENYVLADMQERRTRIEQGIEQALPSQAQVLADPELLEMVVHLNEYPFVLAGGFSPQFLTIPAEILITVMRHHQKYFAVMDSEGNLLPHFLTVLNGSGDSAGEIRRGHERVLRARLEDAAFFWQQDQAVPLADRLKRLEQILFQERLGSYADKTRRVQALCARLSGDPELDQAARLAKTDLTTAMVREFTELQGVMGGLYARQESYPEPVWRAVYEHYRPQSLDEPAPETPLGALLSIADKIDTVVGCFGIGIVPTGSSDPLALRRQAQGIIKTLLEHRLSIPLAELVEAAQANYPEAQDPARTRREVLEFLSHRVRFLLQELGFPNDVVQAVLAVGVTEVHQAQRKALALTSIRREPDFAALAVAYKRIRNILSKQVLDTVTLRPDLLSDRAEVELAGAFEDLSGKVARWVEEGEYAQALRAIAALRSPVDRFFDDVMVMVEDDEVRNNRLKLLSEISQLFLSIADISEIKEEIND